MMPDITYSTTFADGVALSANAIATNIYNPNATPNSMEVINGWLDNANRDASWNIKRDHIRPGACTGGRQVGLTGVLDFFNETFTTDNTDADAYISVSGCSMAFHLPRQPALFMLMWQFVAANDVTIGSAAGQVEFRLSLDNSAVAPQVRVMPGAVYGAGTTRYRTRDRIWSGSHVRANATDTSVIAAGYHTATIQLWSQAKTTRCRVRNMKYYWIA